ncbi:hypothetical protein HWQ46_10025 [Shewanella sp. D64]|uniref:hypothetical protein n=1 Tax=unclassified Shewanella TaxID=196818 RepID=UPI0022BA65BA|nr:MULTISPECIES: hypothetical protein [unclassified Shewanella]MEC4725881.1 hypothetical protein [Shewanella sp. D64]MEC4737136.1 hypothetical protein [Shewanella sp. E94]WBJ95671.1 hypothetical protein HWQ47_00610 [Shewanella sp. MTB7]
MISRRNLKQEHELAVLNSFAEHLKMEGKSLEILEQPDPPEAIVNINKIKTWIEITDAFLDQEHARSLMSSIADEVPHIVDETRVEDEIKPDFQSVVHGVIAKKYDKKTMLQTHSTFGRGILLVGIFTPFNSASGIALEERENIRELVDNKSMAIFDKIYVYDGTLEHKFYLLFELI